MPDDFDVQRQARAGSTAALRALVAGYLVYLGVTLIRNLLNGSSPLPTAAAWCAGIVFIGGGVALCSGALIALRADACGQAWPLWHRRRSYGARERARALRRRCAR